MTAVSIQPAEIGPSQAQVLSRIAPFEDLPEAVLSLLSDQSETRDYSAGQTVFSLGQYDGAEFLVVLSGALRVSVTDGATGAMLIEEVSQGGIFGLEIAIADPDPSMFQQIAVTAEKDCKLALIDAAEFKSLAANRPSLMRNVAIHLASQLVAQRFRAMGAQAAPEQRVYAVLLECVERDAVSGAWKIDKMPKHRELADRAGVDEAAAAGAIAALIQEGVAQRNYPGLIVNDMSRLNQLAS
ncbi:Crp/Fnr family transcriptional regulator [Marinicaulis aureus]|uniref:Crp/Fnr family transcriptional regulator n=1 Tax=Hyphococcus aureus TaxID=2666033 RepID=A0ABW1KRM6_9PROT